MRNVKQLHFSILIKAPVQIVWQQMFDQDSYRSWTAAFCEGSYFEGSWQKGETIRFLSPSGDGMVAVIAECRPLEFVSIKHLGFVVKGEDDVDSENVRSWAPAFENYRFRTVAGGTELSIEQDIAAEYEQYMQNTWPLALKKLQALCEQH